MRSHHHEQWRQAKIIEEKVLRAEKDYDLDHARRKRVKDANKKYRNENRKDKHDLRESRNQRNHVIEKSQLFIDSGERMESTPNIAFWDHVNASRKDSKSNPDFPTGRRKESTADAYLKKRARHQKQKRSRRQKVAPKEESTFEKVMNVIAFPEKHISLPLNQDWFFKDNPFINGVKRKLEESPTFDEVIECALPVKHSALPSQDCCVENNYLIAGVSNNPMERKKETTLEKMIDELALRQLALPSQDWCVEHNYLINGVSNEPLDRKKEEETTFEKIMNVVAFPEKHIKLPSQHDMVVAANHVIGSLSTETFERKPGEDSTFEQVMNVIAFPENWFSKQNDARSRAGAIPSTRRHLPETSKFKALKSIRTELDRLKRDIDSRLQEQSLCSDNAINGEARSDQCSLPSQPSNFDPNEARPRHDKEKRLRLQNQVLSSLDKNQNHIRTETLRTHKQRKTRPGTDPSRLLES